MISLVPFSTMGYSTYSVRWGFAGADIRVNHFELECLLWNTILHFAIINKIINTSL